MTEVLVVINTIINIVLILYVLYKLRQRRLKNETLQMFEDALGVVARRDMSAQFNSITMSRLNYIVLPYDKSLDYKIRQSLDGIIRNEKI